MWGATSPARLLDAHSVISTHAPRVGSDFICQNTAIIMANFNSRSPCGERPQHTRANHTKALFQLTLPVWGATQARRQDSTEPHYFNSRSPCGERLIPMAVRCESVSFQLTLPVWGATVTPPLHITQGIFQLTLPVWGATAKMRYSVHYTDNIPISPNIRISQSRQTWNTLLFSNFREIKIFDSCSNSTQIQGANIPGEG